MKQLSSHLSKPRRRIHGLLAAGLASAAIAAGLGGLIFALGRSRADVTLPFWECGQYVMLLGLLNLGLYGALLWQVNRLSRRERLPLASVPPLDLRASSGGDRLDESAPPAQGTSGTAPPSAAPRPVSRRVRGTPASLNLEP